MTERRLRTLAWVAVGIVAAVVAWRAFIGQPSAEDHSRPSPESLGAAPQGLNAVERMTPAPRATEQMDPTHTEHARVVNSRSSKPKDAGVIDMQASQRPAADGQNGAGDFVELLPPADGSDEAAMTVADEQALVEPEDRADSPSRTGRRGVPFPVSKSVLVERAGRCRPPEKPGACELIGAHLARFQSEERDEGWATRTEAGIRRVIAERDGPVLELRHVECRTSVCFVEVVAGPGEFVGFREEEEATLGLRNGWVDYGLETRTDLVKQLIQLQSALRIRK